MAATALAVVVLAAATAALFGLGIIGSGRARLVAVLDDHGSGLGGVTSVAFSPDGTMLAVGDADGSVYLWDPASHRLLATLTSPAAAGSTTSVAFSPDSKALAAANSDGSVYLWNAATDRLTGALTDPVSDAIITSVAFSPDGKTVAGGDSASGTCLWDAATTVLKARLVASTGTATGVLAVSFSSAGTLAVGSQDGNVYLWNATTGQLTAKLISTTNTGGIWSVAFSTDGKMLAAANGASANRTELWDVATRRQAGSVGRSGVTVNAVAFSPAGTTLATGEYNDSTYLWNAASSTSAPSTTLADPGGKSVNAVAFSPSGTTLATADSDDRTYLWAVP